MKALTFAIPSYNAAQYLPTCVESLLKGGQDVEILIIDDGSTDETGQIADAYAAQYPTIIKAIHQPNAGHGGAVNNGLKHATGQYYKVVDADDWVDESALKTVLKTIQDFESKDQSVDLFVCNYVYENKYKHKSHVVRFNNVFPTDQVCTWQDTKHFHMTQYMIMHALIYKTEVLRQSGLELPLHTFYVDNLVASIPLPFVKTIYYLDVDFYRYFIGRPDQSTNPEVMMTRIDQQIKVTKILIDYFDNLKDIEPKLKSILKRDVSILVAISSIHLLMIGTPDALQKRDELWDYIRDRNPKLYRKLRFTSICTYTNLPTRSGDLVSELGYRFARKIVKFQ